MPAAPHFIDTKAALLDFCRHLEGQPALAIDTEFIREQTYVPKVELVQVATPDGRAAVIDYGTIGRLADDPLAEALADPGVLKVFHAADQDLEMFHILWDFVPGPIWDTQLVTGLFGYGGRVGYAAVVENLLGAKPAKGETLTDWSQRPLTPEQLHYAAEDVRYLLPLYEKERRELAALGREAWAHEECARVRANVEATIACRSEDATLFQRVRGWTSLDRRGLAVLRELAVWREEEAYRRNRPRGSVMKDEILVEIARRAPGHPSKLKALRGIHPKDLERHGDAIVQVVARGGKVPPAECPLPPAPGVQLGEAEQALASLLQAVLQATATEKKVSATLVATVGQLQQLVDAHMRGDARALPVLSGWRGELVGQDLLAILEGRAAVFWDPEKRALRIEEPSV